MSKVLRLFEEILEETSDLCAKMIAEFEQFRMPGP